MGKYVITVKPQLLDMSFEGIFSPAEVQAFVADFQNQVKKINPVSYTLRLDGTKLAVSAKDMQELLKGCLQLYKASGFDKVILSIGDNVVVKMQVQRLAKEIGFTDITVE